MSVVESKQRTKKIKRDKTQQASKGVGSVDVDKLRQKQILREKRERERLFRSLGMKLDGKNVYREYHDTPFRGDPSRVPDFLKRSRLMFSTIGGVVGWLVFATLVVCVLVFLNRVNATYFDSFVTVRLWLLPRWVSYLFFGLRQPFAIIMGIITGFVTWYVIGRYIKRVEVFEFGHNLSTYEEDSYLLSVNELFRRYKAVPDTGAHYRNVSASGIVSHVVLSNDGLRGDWMGEGDLPRLSVPKHLDTDGSGDFFDVKGGLKCLETVGMRDPRYSGLYYSPEDLFVSEDESLAAYIRRNFYIPEYETERPQGVYLVDDSPINTMVVAMTRGNKGQCIINPFADLLSRQDIKVNMVFNDPKGELYTSFYQTFKMRGFDVIVFNLLDPVYTDQCNPLASAVTYCRKDYMNQTQESITILADSFFPDDGGGDNAFWTRAEKRLFGALAYLLLDIYYEEEQDYLYVHGLKDTQEVLGLYLDNLWSFVTLSNVYRMVSVLGTRMFDPPTLVENDDLLIEKSAVSVQEGQAGAVNMLSKMMELSATLPDSKLRRLFKGPYGELQAMADSEKMRASIYGLALTDMSFFTEGPVMSLTNVSPRQSFDMTSLSFPRRFLFRFSASYIEQYALTSASVRFDLYTDPYFENQLDAVDFGHDTRIDALGWVEMRFAGIIPTDVSYIKMSVYSREGQGVHYGTYYARFTKGYKISTDGRHFMFDRYLNTFPVQDGIIDVGQLVLKDGRFCFSDETPPTVQLLRDEVEERVFELTDVSYRERPLAIFCVTPPNRSVYFKISLMMYHSMFNTSVGESYFTKEDGKPILETHYIFDELGNLDFEGSGIQNFAQKLTIGLAQGQRYMMVFQTLQQIKDVYGDTMDRIIESNVGLTTFLLSSDLDMLETFSKRSGITHVVRGDQQSNTETVGTLVDMVEDSVTISRSLKEEPLLSVERLSRMTNGEALMLSTTKRQDNDGNNIRQQPILCTRETSLPMSWFLHRNGYRKRGDSMLTVETENNTLAVADKIPEYERFLLKRAKQVAYMPTAIEIYKEMEGLTDSSFETRRAANADDVGRRLMLIVNRLIYGLEYLEEVNRIKEEESEFRDAKLEELEASRLPNYGVRDSDVQLIGLLDKYIRLEQESGESTSDKVEQSVNIGVNGTVTTSSDVGGNNPFLNQSSVDNQNVASGANVIDSFEDSGVKETVEQSDAFITILNNARFGGLEGAFSAEEIFQDFRSSEVVEPNTQLKDYLIENEASLKNKKGLYPADFYRHFSRSGIRFKKEFLIVLTSVLTSYFIKDGFGFGKGVDPDKLRHFVENANRVLGDPDHWGLPENLKEYKWVVSNKTGNQTTNQAGYDVTIQGPGMESLVAFSVVQHSVQNTSAKETSRRQTEDGVDYSVTTGGERSIDKAGSNHVIDNLFTSSNDSSSAGNSSQVLTASIGMFVLLNRYWDDLFTGIASANVGFDQTSESFVKRLRDKWEHRNDGTV